MGTTGLLHTICYWLSHAPIANLALPNKLILSIIYSGSQRFDKCNYCSVDYSTILIFFFITIFDRRLLYNQYNFQLFFNFQHVKLLVVCFFFNFLEVRMILIFQIIQFSKVMAWLLWNSLMPDATFYTSSITQLLKTATSAKFNLFE